MEPSAPGTYSSTSLSKQFPHRHNVLTGGAIGRISRSRTYNTASYVPVKAPTDRWFHYDQMGSVMIETNSSSGLAQRHYQDAFGNTLSTWNAGHWGGDQDGWHHNTKERDANTGLVYMYQRWYLAETGTFASQAPYPSHIEHQYGFAFSKPTSVHDVMGTHPSSTSSGNKVQDAMDACFKVTCGSESKAYFCTDYCNCLANQLGFDSKWAAGCSLGCKKTIEKIRKDSGDNTWHPCDKKPPKCPTTESGPEQPEKQPPGSGPIA